RHPQAGRHHAERRPPRQNRSERRQRLARRPLYLQQRNDRRLRFLTISYLRNLTRFDSLSILPNSVRLHSSGKQGNRCAHEGFEPSAHTDAQPSKPSATFERPSKGHRRIAPWLITELFYTI